MSKTVFQWLIEQFPQSKKQSLREMVERGRVTLNGAAVKSLKQPVGAGDTVAVEDHAVPSPAGIAPLKIVHEDPDILVVFKPAGLLTSTVPRERRPTAISTVRSYLAAREPAARPGVVHRLDREAAGLLVFSKNNAAFESLKKQFYHHTVDRVYMALVEGKPSPAEGVIRGRLIESPDGTVKVTRVPTKGQEAVTEYKLLRTSGGQSLVRVTLQTGRKHQIRAQFSHRGCPIVGDAMYGAKTGEAHGLQLVATNLAFEHPRTGERMTFEVPLPARMRQLVDEPPA